MTLNYPGGPRINYTDLGLTQLIQGPTPIKTIGIVGDSYKGSDHATVLSLSDAMKYYGVPTYNYLSSVGPQSVGAKIPFALMMLSKVAQMPNAQQFNVCVMAAGKVNATATFTGSPGFVFVATGQYAGTAGTHLSMTINGSSGTVSSITVTDTRGSGTVVQSFVAYPNGPYDLSTPTAIANAINGANPIDNPNSIIRCSVIGVIPGSLPATQAFANVSASDGVGATATDSTIQTLLTESLAFDIDYIVPLWDFATFINGNGFLSYASAAAAQLADRMYVGGPDSSMTYTSLSGGGGSAYSSTMAKSQKYNVWGVPPVVITDPVTGVPTARDPYWFGLLMAAFKAAYSPQNTLDQLQVPGVSGFAGWPDHIGFLQDSDLQAIGAGGFATATQRNAQTGVYVEDNLSFAPYSLDGQNINVFYQFSIADQDHYVAKTVIAACRAWKGQTGMGNTVIAQNIAEDIDSALDQLTWIVSHKTTCTPNSNNPFAYSIDVAWRPQYPVLEQDVTSHFDF